MTPTTRNSFLLAALLLTACPGPQPGGGTPTSASNVPTATVAPEPSVAPTAEPDDDDDEPEPAASASAAPDASASADTKLQPDGDTCTTGADCQSGICEGKGCGPDEGKCMPAKRSCTRDLRQFCGCDGKTFQNSSRCPGRTYAHTGACP